MGCCIPKRKNISVLTIKKGTQIESAKYEKSNDRTNINKPLAHLELQKYYLPIPNQEQNPKLNSSSNTDIVFSFQNPLENIGNSNKINSKKIKESLRILKDISSSEVNNCTKYFKEKI
jgi:hypothetical protein